MLYFENVKCKCQGHQQCLKIFAGADFSNAVLDRVNFGKANLQGAVFKNSTTVLSDSTFVEAQLEDAVFKDTIIGYIDLQFRRRFVQIHQSVQMEGVSWPGC